MSDDRSRRASTARNYDVAVAEIKKDIGNLDRHDRDQARLLTKLQEVLVQHGQRLDTGTHSFGNLKTRLETVEARTMPKPPSPMKIIGITLTVILSGAAALWGLSEMLNIRPTEEKVEKRLDEHDQNGHRSLRDNMHGIQREQAVQRKLIDDVEEQQDEDSKKLDTLLERLPTPRRRARRQP